MPTRVAFDTLPLTNPHLETSSAVIDFARALDLVGRSGKFDVVVPYTWLSGSATYQGGPIEGLVDGPGDPCCGCRSTCWAHPR